jgi:hypothetical protein
MQFQKSHVSIVRSIRQVSLVRDWLRARKDMPLPNIATFEPNERAGDASDLSIFRVVADAERMAYICMQAGERVQSIYDEAMHERPLHDCLDAEMAAAATPIWNACISTRLPVYSIIPVSDPDGCPVTIEQIFLPYSKGNAKPDFMVASLHACSTEGRFVSKGLLRNKGKTPSHWTVVIDPAAAPASRPAPGGIAEIDNIVPEQRTGTRAG